jgi:Mrp family chromosome partitioning ATPase
MELLSSARMEKALETMREAYDYVILDLPPVGEVSDALAIAKETDGILLVVRQNYCDRNVLSETVRQFEFIHAKTLGIVFNCTSEGGGKGYYRKYYRRYYKGYSKTYEQNNRSASN